MRAFIVVALWLLATTMIAQEQQERPNMPFYNKQKIDEALKRQTEYDTVWLPIKVTYHNHYLDTMFLVKYEYNEFGLLQKFTRNDPNGVSEYIYNQTRLVEGEDVLDTLVWYRYDAFGNRIPERRFIYENCQDDFYFAIHDQQWKNNQWTTIYMSEKYFIDTLKVVEFPYWERDFAHGVLTYAHRYTLEKFDERGNVIDISYHTYIPDTKEYIKLIEYKYFYDENNVCYERNTYREWEYGSGWVLRGKVFWEW